MVTSYYDATSSSGDSWPSLCNGSYSNSTFEFECNVCNVNNVCIPTRRVLFLFFHDQYMVCSVLIEPKMSSGGHRAAEKSSSSLSDRPSLGTSLKPCIRRLIVYTDTLAEWVYGYVDLAWLCLRIRRLGGSCLRILSTDTTGIHVALGCSRTICPYCR